jgi:hypothetical protein
MKRVTTIAGNNLAIPPGIRWLMRQRISCHTNRLPLTKALLTAWIQQARPFGWKASINFVDENHSTG